MRIKKEIAIFFVFVLCFSKNLFSLPGFSPKIKDVSGEYVYYKDKTFSRESYIGFLYYDERTYCVRYYSPKTKEGLPPLQIRIYFTIKTDIPHIEFLGETIDSDKTEDDRDIINYIHDLFYTLQKKRAELGEVGKGEVTQKTQMVQFGGEVEIVFDEFFPLFNIKEIKNGKGESLFSIATTGRLQSDEDTSFGDFIGFPAQYNDNNHTFKKNKKATSTQYSIESGQSVRLDSMWKRSMQNVWTLENCAVLTCVNSERDLSKSIMRQLLHSTDSSFKDWGSLSIEETKTGYLVNATIYQTKTKNAIHLVNKFDRGGESGFCYLSMTVFKNVYDKNKRYFLDVIEGKL